MKSWTILKLWLLCCGVTFGFYILIEGLYTYGIFGMAGISPLDYENISFTGFVIFEITTVVGTSLLLAIVLWNVISNVLESTPGQKTFQFLLEAVQLWL
ncbi:MAG: hypothetical protein JSV04_11375, partial [Candidatus Heimdallarchaeota archaeon]